MPVEAKIAAYHSASRTSLPERYRSHIADSA
jgi:hypothetical protein